MDITSSTSMPIVTVSKGRVYATSKDVAAYFGKRHYTVIEAIDDLLKQDDAIARNFLGIEIDTRVGFGFRKDRGYEMDRDGFTLLAMGFTGAKAIGFKLKFIAAFNEAERRLKMLEQPYQRNFARM